MEKAEVENQPVVYLLMIFARYGGWVMILLTAVMWHWSGMAFLGALYLIFIAPVVMIVLAVILYQQRGRSKYHNCAFWASAIYICLPIVVVGMRVAFRSVYGE